jgi:hypothetical protein
MGTAATLQAKGLDERAIAKELGVTSLLTGAVQRAGGQIRINMSLVSASDGAVRWTEKYDRPIANGLLQHRESTPGENDERLHRQHPTGLSPFGDRRPSFLRPGLEFSSRRDSRCRANGRSSPSHRA